jgi:hypothetical protein
MVDVTVCPWRNSRAIAVAVISAVALMATAPVRATQVADVQVKAAFLFNFARFVQWPASPDRPLIIGIAGDKPLAAVVAATVKGRTVSGRAVEVRVLEIADSPDGCDVLHLGGGSDIDQTAMLSRVRGPMLTIGETPRFLRSGGMIRIFFEGQRLRFQVNQRQTDAAGLRLSSQALSLAAK